MSTKGTTMKTNIEKIVIKTLSAVMITAIISFIGFAVWMKYDNKTVSKRVMAADHKAVLKACREMMQNKDKYQPARTGNLKGEIFIDSFSDITPGVPVIIQDLDPEHILLGNDRAEVYFQAGLTHMGFIAYPEGVKGKGQKKLIDGLYLFVLSD